MEPSSKRAKGSAEAVELTEVDQLRAKVKQLKDALEWMQSGYTKLAQEHTRRDEEERARNQSLRSVISRRSSIAFVHPMYDDCWNRFREETQEPYRMQCADVAWRIWQEWVAAQGWTKTGSEESEESDENN